MNPETKDIIILPAFATYNFQNEIMSDKFSCKTVWNCETKSGLKEVDSKNSLKEFGKNLQFIIMWSAHKVDIFVWSSAK